MDAVEQIASSAAIGSGSRLPALLRYVVIEELEGRGDRLKAYTIGTDVCGKSAGFDPQSDSSVRVEMGRLRKALGDFYRFEAPANLVVIDIPVGTYRPLFRQPVCGDEILARPVSGHPAGSGRAAALRVSAAVGLALCILFALGIYASISTEGGMAREPSRVAVNDFEVESPGQEALGEAMAHVVQRELAATKWMSVYRVSPSRPERGDPDYRVTGVISGSGERPELTVRLLDGHTGESLYDDVVSLDRPAAGPGSGLVAPSVGIGLAIAIGRARGETGGALPESSGQWSAAPLNHEGFRCFLRVYDLPFGLPLQEQQELGPCLKTFTEENPGFAPGWAARSVVSLTIFISTGNADNELLRDAVAARDTAEQLDPRDPMVLKARYTLAVMRPERDMPGFRSIVAEALNSAPRDPDLLADIANKLAMFGSDPKEAEALSRRALEFNTQPPGWYWWAPTTLAMLHGRSAEAYAYSLRIEARTRRQLECIRAVTAAQLDLVDETASHIAALRELGVNSLEDMIAAIRMARFSAPVEAVFLNGARRAYEIIAHEGGARRRPRPDKPVVYIGGNPRDVAQMEGLVSEFRAMVSAFDYVTVSDSDSPRGGQDAWPEEYLLRVRDSAFDERIGLELVHLATGVIVATDRVPRMQVTEAAAEPYARAAVRLFSKRGNMMVHYLAQPDVSPDMDCIGKTWEFLRSYRREAYRLAVQCAEGRLASGTGESLTYTHYALLLFEQYLRQPSEQAQMTLERALTSARRAVELAPASPAAHAILSWLFHLAGQPELQEYHDRMALAGVVVEPDVIALTARAYCVTGRADECLERMRQAGRFDTVSPSWHDLQRYLGYYAKGEMARARAYARLFSDDEVALQVVARAISAQQLSDFDRANVLAARLRRLDPVFSCSPEEPFRRQKFSAELTEALLHDLLMAGMGERLQAENAPVQVRAVR
ncbi:MAG: hypothetical protein AB7O39_04545 [Flavobacteriaceae bacterium]